MKKAIWITAICVLAVMIFAACSNSADKNIAVNDSENVSSSAGNVSSDETVTESAELSTDTAEQNAADKQQSTSGSSTNNMPNETAVQQKETNTSVGTTAKRQTTTQKQTTTKRQTSTRTPATTKKPTTTKTPTTTKKSGVCQSDVQWIQSQAHAYMRSKGIIVDSGVGSYSGRISSVNRTKEELLDEVKEWIDGEYNDCKASGYDTVYMYCKIENRGNGSYFLYVMYG